MSAPKPRNRIVTLLLWGGGLFLAAVCGLLAIGVNNMPARTAAVAPTAPPTPIPAPTSTPAPTAAPRGYVSRATLGAAWPLTVEEGMMQCLRPQQVYLLSLDRQRVWAVNAPARSQIEEKGWSDIMDIATPGADLSPLIQVGLALCP